MKRVEVSGAVVDVHRGLTRTSGTWMSDTDRFARWRRLVVLGLDLAPAAHRPRPRHR
jgi:hypothetical protein